MNKKTNLLVLAFATIFSFLYFSFPCFAQEQITITTYYPAPFGVYHELRTDQLAVGSAYRASALSDGQLIVSGNVGIGVPSPAVKLDVAGGINATGNIYAGSYYPTGAATINAPSMEIGGSGTGKIYLHHHGVIAHQLRYASGTLFLEATTNGYGTNATPSLSIGSTTGSKLGIGTTAPYSNLQVNGTANTCVQMYYDTGTYGGDRYCPTSTYITIPDTVPANPSGAGYFMCCRVCPNVDWNRDGICND